MADLKALYQEALDAFVQGDYDRAIEGFQRVTELDATFCIAYQGLAEACSKRGDLDAAIRAIQKAIDLDPAEPLYHTSLSRFYQIQGRIPEAEQESAVAARLQARRGP